MGSDAMGSRIEKNVEENVEIYPKSNCCKLSANEGINIGLDFKIFKVYRTKRCRRKEVGNCE